MGFCFVTNGEMVTARSKINAIAAEKGVPIRYDCFLYIADHVLYIVGGKQIDKETEKKIRDYCQSGQNVCVPLETLQLVSDTY